MMEDRIFAGLSGEGRKAYFEYYAREVLVSLLPERFVSLHKADKPDLQDVYNGIGVEVTLALPEGELLAAGLCGDGSFGGEERKRGKKGDGEQAACDGKADTGASYADARGLLIEAAKRKVERLNNTGDDAVYEYYEFQRYWLFIFASPGAGERGALYELIEAVEEAQRGCERRYEAVFVYSGEFGLFECDLKARQVYEYPVGPELREYLRERAFELAQEVE